ncbi:MAG: hypothetical protein ACE5G0_05560 [Rhodothermales bacterium]
MFFDRRLHMTVVTGMVLLLALAWSGCRLLGLSPRYRVQETRTPLQVGDATVDVVVHETDAPGLTFINLHDNEDTSVRASLKVIRNHGGRLIELQHTGERNVVFSLGDSTYTFDPNRIFTDRGIAATLDALGAYSGEAHDAVRRFAQTLLSFYDLKRGTAVVTAHNNGEGEYSALSYTAGREYEHDAAQVYVADGSDPDDFFFVTDPAVFASLREAGYNVVLQDNAQVTDDGSLSVYAGRSGLVYVNVEAQHGHLKQQVGMMVFLHGLLHARSRPEV